MFHPQKCVMMNLGLQKGITSEHSNLVEYPYSMEGHNLEYSVCEKDLGVHIDRDLSFDKHINFSINKANRVLAITKKTFENIDKETFLYIFKGLVRPHLEYASSVWSPHLIKHIEALESVQRRATKQVPGLSKLPYSERL